MYRNEREVGRAVADSGLARDEVFVTTKLPPGNAGRVRATISESLRALGMDQVDLWLVHWPPGGRSLVQVWRDFLAVRDEGLCRAVGVSNYSIAQIDELTEATGERPAVNQIPWSPSRSDAELHAAHAERHVALEDEHGRLIASTGMVVAEVEVAGERFPVIGFGGVIVAARHRSKCRTARGERDWWPPRTTTRRRRNWKTSGHGARWKGPFPRRSAPAPA